MLLTLYLILGSIVGLLAGLLGVGGGLIIVPALIYAFSELKMHNAILTHLAIGTSLACIVFTSISAIKIHHKNNSIQWNIVLFLFFGSLIGSILGVIFASKISGEHLQSLLAIFVFVIAIRMWIGFNNTHKSKKIKKITLSLLSIIIGFISSLFGISGGILITPLLQYFGININHAIATAATIGFPIALIGALSNAYVGYENPYLPEWSTGYIYWPAFIGIIITSSIFARVGATLSYKIPQKRLKMFFSIFLFTVSLSLFFFQRNTL